MERFSTLPGRATDEHDPPVVTKAIGRRPAGVEDGVEVGIDRPMPSFIGELRDGLVFRRPNPVVTDEDVEPFELHIASRE